MIGLLRAACVALALMLVGAATARAGQILTLDTNHAHLPQIAVDGSGVAHFVWLQSVNGGNDVLHYCRIPAGANACDHRVDLAPPLSDGGETTTSFDKPTLVLTATPGQLVILAARCCASFTMPNGKTTDSPTFMWISNDGGNSFTSPQIVGGDAPTSGIGAFGPGGFSVSTISDVVTAGTFFKAIPVAGYAGDSSHIDGNANVGDVGNGTDVAQYAGSIAMVNPTTPLIAEREISGGASTVYWREQSGQGDPNSLSTWGPAHALDHGDDPQVVSGPRGVFMVELERIPDRGNVYVVRRFTGSGFTAGKPVSEVGDPIFRYFTEDSGGTLHLVWSDGSRNLVQRESYDGSTWRAPAQLSPESQWGGQYHLMLAACGPGDGWVAWDANGGDPSGSVHAMRIGNGTQCGPASDPNCPLTLTVGVARLLATSGCFARRPDGTFTSPGAVRVNGLDLTPDTGGVTVDPVHRILTAGVASVTSGSLTLGRQALDWLLPAAPGPLIDAGTGDLAALHTGAAGTKLLGLPISGVVTPIFGAGGTASLPLNVPVPSPVDGFGSGQPTSDITLQASEDNPLGLSIGPGGVHIHVDDVFIGPAEIKPFDLNYVADPGILSGHVGLILPVIGSTLDTTFTIQNGTFRDLTSSLDLASPPSIYAPFGLPLAESVFLRSVTLHGNDFISCAQPADIHGSASVTGGPTIAGTALVQVDGTVGYQFPRASCGLPGVFYINGTGKLVGLSVADLQFMYKTSGEVTLGAHLHLGDPKEIGIEAAIDGGIDLPSHQFYAEGKAGLSVAGYDLASADLVVSSIGLGGCATLLPIPNPFNGFKTIQAGFRYVWGEGLTPYLADCDVSDLVPASFGGAADLGGVGPRGRAHAAGAPATVTLPAGLPSAAIVAIGTASAPHMQLTGPGGLKVSTPTQAGAVTGGSGAAQIAMFPSLRQTAIKLIHPKAGTYAVTATGGDQISRVLSGKGVPAPTIRGSVLGAGGQRALVYRLRAIPGQIVRFEETGSGVLRIIGTAKGAGGRLLFTPGRGPAGVRHVFALVSQNGFPRARIPLAAYRVPDTLRLPAPQLVRVRRAVKQTLVTWTRVPGARRYVVRAKLSDGRNLELVTRAARLQIPTPAGFTAGQVRVAALDAGNLVGAFASATLRPHAVACPRGERRARGRCRVAPVSRRRGH